MHRVIDRREPAQLHRKDHNHQDTGKKWRHGKADHRDECPGLVKDGILPVSRDYSNRQGNENTHHIGHTHNPKRLGQALDHDVNHRRAGLPGDHSKLSFGQARTEKRINPIERLYPKKLNDPFEILNMDRLAEAKRFAHLLLDLGRHGQRHLRHRIARSQLQQ